MLDYGIALRCDNGSLGIVKLYSLLHLLVLLKGDKSNAYIQSIILGILFIVHMAKHKLPQYQMLTDGLAMYNEEAGENSFAVLARAALADTQKKKVEVMNNYYGGLNRLRAFDEEFRKQRENPNNKFQGNYRKTYSKDCEDVVGMTQFLKIHVRKIKAKSKYGQYDGSAEGFQNFEKAQGHIIAYKKTEGTWKDWSVIEGWLEKQFDKCRKFVNTNSGLTLPGIWPEMVFNSDTEEEKQDYSESESEQEGIAQEVAAAIRKRSRKCVDNNEDEIEDDVSVPLAKPHRRARMDSAVSEDGDLSDGTIHSRRTWKSYHSSIDYDVRERSKAPSDPENSADSAEDSPSPATPS